MKCLLSLSLALGVAFASEATVYRAGLAGGFINSFDANNFYSTPIADIGYFNGPVAGWEKGSGGDKKTYPPVWQNNRTWSYHGQMYFDGGTYYFGKNIDDATYIAVDGVQLLRDTNWNKFMSTAALSPTVGWHDVVFRLGNGTGGAGCSNGTMGRDGRQLGLGYAKDPASAPTATTDLDRIVDPGDGTILRTADASADYIRVNSIAKTQTGYSLNVTISAQSPTELVLYAGTSAGTAGSSEGWAQSSAPIAFAANETKDVAVDGAFATPPYFQLYLGGTGTSVEEGEGVYFWQWSDIIQCTMEPTVSATISSVTAASASLTATLGYRIVVEGMTPPAIALRAYYGATDFGATSEGWTGTADLGDANAAGDVACTLTDLATGPYYVRFAAKTAESGWIFSEALAFSTAGVSLGAVPAMVAENDPTEKSFTVLRPAEASAEALTVALAYSGATEKVAGLSASVTFDAGVSSVTVPFTMVDDSVSGGDANLVISIASGSDYVVSSPSTATIAVIDDESSAGEVVWTGAAGDLLWSTPGNWQGGKVPTAADTAVFTDEGLASGATVTVDGAAEVRLLKFSRLAAMTLGGTGTLQLGGVVRTTLAGTQANIDIKVALMIYPTDGANCDWNVAESSRVRLYAVTTRAVTPCTFRKIGGGVLELAQKGAVASGTLVVYEGRVEQTVNESTKGVVSVGGGPNAATFSAGKNLAYNINPYAYTNGTFSLGDHVSSGPESFHAYEGGYIWIHASYAGKFELTGGRIDIGYRIWAGCYGQNITIKESGLTARLNGNVTASEYYDYDVKVADGAQPIDFIFNGGIVGGSTSKSCKITGAGTMKTLKDWSDFKMNPSMTSTTWYMDNPGTCGSGRGNLTVGENATLGGVGTFGGYAESQKLTVKGSSATKLATLAPGTVSEDGVHSNGIFTVGSETVTNTLVLGANARLRLGLGERDAKTRLSPADKLVVHGTLAIGSNVALDLVTNTAADFEKVRGGMYTLVEADEITGSFSEVSVPKKSWRVASVTEAGVVKRLVLTVPSAGVKLFVR